VIGEIATTAKGVDTGAKSAATVEVGRTGTIQKDDCGDVVEEALAAALQGATAAGEWTTVAQLARELQARREARAASNVVRLDAARRGRA
jgi:hypothetical protein